MTLVITVIAAVAVTAVWYSHPRDTMRLSTLMFMFWGASVMWFVDAVFEFVDLKEEYFHPSLSDVASDTFLGLSVTALALVIWVVDFLIHDPRGRVKKQLTDGDQKRS